MAEMGGAHPQTPIHSMSSSLCLLPLEGNRSSQIKQNPKRKLEDYLDPILLHTISSRIGRTETKGKQIERKDVFVDSNQRTEFDWPLDRFDLLVNNPNRDSGSEYDGARFFASTIPPLSKRRRSDFPVWTVNDNKHGA
ncbi:unnamed protein product [Thlaspi arvense]|uniref:Uncharacterized protein n=1 Tax=Thlaspi arvense TaxID=13288 RepID=A0AAU9SYI9_THLAR|nr:unnamed protein product [Thlaspi arvense]